MRLWFDAAKCLPARRDPLQGFTTEAWLCALVQGLVTGGRGFLATEPMRGDRPLVSILGLAKAPSAETVEEVIKYLACDGVGGHEALLTMRHRQVIRLLAREQMNGLMKHDFVLVRGDGTLLETQGKAKDAPERIDGAWGWMASGIFIGSNLVACDFSRVVVSKESTIMTEEKVATVVGDKPRSEAELVVTRRLLPGAATTLAKAGLANKSLVLMDPLDGEGTTLTILESITGSRHIVGANKLVRTGAVLCEQPDSQWKDTGDATQCRGWAGSAVCVATIQCEGWEAKRTLVGRRWRNGGELIWNDSGLVTNLAAGDPRMKAAMTTRKCSFAGAVWHLYSHKQGMENQWKDLLRDVGLHTMPCGKAAVNAVFPAIAALALNIKTGYARLRLSKAAMTLWGFGRDVLGLPARIPRRAGGVLVHLLVRARATVPRNRCRLRQTRRPVAQQTPSQSNIKRTAQQEPNTPQTPQKAQQDYAHSSTPLLPPAGQNLG